MRRGLYYPTLYVVKEDGDPALRAWALAALIQDRGDQTPSYQQWLGQLRDKVRTAFRTPSRSVVLMLLCADSYKLRIGFCVHTRWHDPGTAQECREP